MPIYEYQCLSCNLRFEVKQSFHDNSVVTCPKCHNQTRRLFFLAPIIFKGPGFYVTDSRTPAQKENKPPGQPEKDKD